MLTLTLKRKWRWLHSGEDATSAIEHLWAPGRWESSLCDYVEIGADDDGGIGVDHPRILMAEMLNPFSLFIFHPALSKTPVNLFQSCSRSPKQNLVFSPDKNPDNSYDCVYATVVGRSVLLVDAECDLSSHVAPVCQCFASNCVFS